MLLPNGMPANPKNVRCACETIATTGTVIVAGEIRTQAYVDVPEIARGVIRRHRLRPRQVRFRLRYLRRVEYHPRAVPRYRSGRRRVV